MDQNFINITLEDIFIEKKFEAEKINPFPLQVTNETVAVLEKFTQKTIDSLNVRYNADKTFLLFNTETEQIYRRSTKSLVYYMDAAELKIYPLLSQKVLHASFSPNGKMIAYVFDNNLYIHFISTKLTIAVTTDGQWNKIINGNCDWVYEEEFAFSQAYYWSPDSSCIAFYRFDESKVKEYSFPVYEDNYNSNYTYKYPKAGEINSIVSIHCFHVENQKTIEYTPTSEQGYIPKVAWSPDGQLYIFHLNRHQNKLQIWENDAFGQLSSLFYEESDERYIDFTDDWFFLPSQRMIFTSEQSGFRNIYLKEGGKQAIPLTQNHFELSHIVAIDEKNQWIYFTAAFPNPMERQLFVVDFSGKQKQLTEESGWNTVFCDHDYTTIIIENSTIRTPPTYKQYTVISDKATPSLPSLEYEKTIADNRNLNKILSNYRLGDIVFTPLPIEEKQHLNSWMLFPPDFDPNKKYPVLFCNYGGPGSQTVVDRFGAVTMWQHYFSQKGFILISVDNKGTGGRGADYKKKTYLKLGKYEIEDQIAAAKVIARLPYVNANCIGHWGWSFGGFMSCLAISQGAGIFQFAIAIAPVTSWKYYDTIYTERYMRTPQENENGYESCSPFNYIDNIKGKFLLIHGSADDNVHLQHTMQLSKALIEKNIAFDMAIYPDKDHRIQGGNTSLHLWKRIDAWLETNN